MNENRLFRRKILPGLPRGRGPDDIRVWRIEGKGQEENIGISLDRGHLVVWTGFMNLHRSGYAKGLDLFWGLRRINMEFKVRNTCLWYSCKQVPESGIVGIIDRAGVYNPDPSTVHSGFLFPGMRSGSLLFIVRQVKGIVDDHRPDAVPTEIFLCNALVGDDDPGSFLVDKFLIFVCKGSCQGICPLVRVEIKSVENNGNSQFVTRNDCSRRIEKISGTNNARLPPFLLSGSFLSGAPGFSILS